VTDKARCKNIGAGKATKGAHVHDRQTRCEEIGAGNATKGALSTKSCHGSGVIYWYFLALQAHRSG